MDNSLAHLKARFLRLLEGAEVLSLDIFDTTLGRRCQEFKDVFRILEEQLVMDHGEVFRDFASLRSQADRRARERIWNERRREEIDLDDIYRVLAEMRPDWPLSPSEMAAREMGVEHRLLYPIALAKWMIAEARERGLRVVFTSDMYLPKSFCEMCLHEQGFTDYDAFFLSSEVGLLKYNGKLFDHALQTLGIEPGKMLHVGDNPRTDLQQPTRKGIRALQAPTPALPLARHPLKARPEADTRQRLLYGLARQGACLEGCQTDPFWFRIGYQIGGPLLAGYLQFIAGRLAGRNLGKVYFLSRDGYILKQAYDRLAEGRRDLPPSGYLYASRRALNFASIEQIDTAVENWLAEGIHLRVQDFLHRIGLDPLAHEADIRSAGFTGAEQVVVEGADYANLRKLYRLIEPSLLEAAREEREAYLDYLVQEGVHLKDPMVLVDVGWMASIQHSFRRLLRARFPDIHLEGHYIGTYPEARQRADAASQHACYLMQYGEPAAVMRTIRHCVGLLEFFFAAPERTFLRMRRNEQGRLEPEFAAAHENAADLPALEGIHSGMLTYLEEALKINPASPPVHQPEEIAGLLHRLLAEPTPEEATRLGDIRYADGYGAFFHHSWMARPASLREMGLNKAKWKKAFKASHWPKGWFTRLGRVERLLFRWMHPRPNFSKPYG